MKKLKRISLCFDMAGCPNECLHCWIKVENGKRLSSECVEKHSKAFSELTDEIDVYSWFLEPDFLNNYKELWELELKLSNVEHKHFELMSDFRMAFDPEYVKWAFDIGVRKCQLTFFGLEETTDYFTGRKNAFKDLVKAIDLLIEQGIAPRIQVFVYENTIHELQAFEAFIKEINLEERLKEAGLPFELFVHAGSCVGRADKLYKHWVTEKDIKRIPDYFMNQTYKYNKKNAVGIFGHPESVHYQALLKCNETKPIEIENVIFYIDSNLNVFPHFAVQKPWWLLGNLNKDKPQVILSRYLNGESDAQKILSTTPFSEIVKTVNQSDPEKLFIESDYIEMIQEKYLEKIWLKNTIVSE
jgi:MoaA/NifB/PqqE/SkfB family radical SAM enzyme